MSGGGAGLEAARAASREEVRIVAVEPARSDTALLCSVRTSGLPDASSRETLGSGLPAAVVLAFSLLDPSGHERGGSRVEVRIEPDLWEDVVVVRTPLSERRAASIEGVASLMGRLGPFPVLPMRLLDPGQSLRIRVRLAVHPLAPAEIQRVHALFGGEASGGDPDRREVSAGLGTLLRYFLGRERDAGWAADVTSPPFTWGSLARAP